MKQLFLDLDGVLCDLLGGVEILMNVELDHTHGSIDFMEELGISKKEFWESMSIENWASLPKTHDADEILKLVEEFKPVILSANTQYGSANCISGKIEWMKRNIPDYYEDDRWFFGKKKFKLAHPNAILIDDYEFNTKKWEAAGGDTILVPRPWNENGKLGVNTLDYVYNKLMYLLVGG